MRLAALLLLLGAVLVAPSVVSADDGDERPVPDYDGRGDDPTTPGDVAIWVPRLMIATAPSLRNSSRPVVEPATSTTSSARSVASGKNV